MRGGWRCQRPFADHANPTDVDETTTSTVELGAPCSGTPPPPHHQREGQTPGVPRILTGTKCFGQNSASPSRGSQGDEQARRSPALCSLICPPCVEGDQSDSEVRAIGLDLTTEAPTSAAACPGVPESPAEPNETSPDDPSVRDDVDSTDDDDTPPSAGHKQSMREQATPRENIY